MDDLHRLQSITSSSLKLSKCTVEVELSEKAAKGSVDEDEMEGNMMENCKPFPIRTTSSFRRIVCDVTI